MVTAVVAACRRDAAGEWCCEAGKCWAAAAAAAAVVDAKGYVRYRDPSVAVSLPRGRLFPPSMYPQGAQIHLLSQSGHACFGCPVLWVQHIDNVAANHSRHLSGHNIQANVERREGRVAQGFRCVGG